MSRERAISAAMERFDISAALKALYDATAAEPVPAHLLSIVARLPERPRERR